MNFKKISVLFMIFGIYFMTPLIFAQGNNSLEDNYKIYSAKFNEVISIEKIVEDFADYDVIFFGEGHGDSITHYLECLLLEKLYKKYGNSLALSMEMFDRDVQVVLDEYLSNKIREKSFTKDARVWMNYDDYRPMVEFAKEKKLDVIAANAPFRYVNMANTKGQNSLKSLSKPARSFIAPLPYDTATGAYHEKLMWVTSQMKVPEAKGDTVKSDTSTLSKIPPPGMPAISINQGQSLWDATMAYSIYQYLKMNRNKKIMHVNGKFHSDEYFGIVQQLAKYDSRIRYLVISAFADDSFPNIDFNRYKDIADYIIITNPSISETFE